MKTPVKVSVKVQRITGALSRMSIEGVNHLQVYFCGIRSALIFFGREAWGHVRNTCTCTQKISYFHVSHFPSKEKVSCFREKILCFQIIQERSCPGVLLFEKIIFSEHWKKISVYFFQKDHLSFSAWVVISYFREKEISYFPTIQERSYFRAIFLERPSFQDVCKKKIWCSVQ